MSMYNYLINSDIVKVQLQKHMVLPEVKSTGLSICHVHYQD